MCRSGNSGCRLNKTTTLNHSPPPTFQDRAEQSRAEPATLSPNIFPHICSWGPQAVRGATGGPLVLLLDGESGSEGSPWQTMGFAPARGRGPPRWREPQCVSSCQRQCGAIIPSQRNDECNRLFVRRAHLSVFPPSWGCRGTAPSCSTPLALRIFLATSEHQSAQPWGCRSKLG